MTRAGGLGGKATRNGFLPLSVLLRLGQIPVVIVGFAEGCLKEKNGTDEQNDRQNYRQTDGEQTERQMDLQQKIAVLIQDCRRRRG